MTNVLPPEDVLSSVRRDFNRWERKFEFELKNREVLDAWHRLARKCDPTALKSALFFAADSLDGAQEIPEKWAEYRQKRKIILNGIAGLKKPLQRLVAINVAGENVLGFLLTFHRVEGQERLVCENFPTLLEQFQTVLAILKLPAQPLHIQRAFFIASGEALLHIYVYEVTRRRFSGEIAVLLQASAGAYGIDGGPKYSEEAVNRRYRRYKKQVTHAMKELLVRQFIRMNPDVALHEFVKIREDQLLHDPVIHWSQTLPGFG